MDEVLRSRVEGKTILLLGFGREGQASYHLIRSLFPRKMLLIADRDPAMRDHDLLRGDPFVQVFAGDHYLQETPKTDLVIKSPGISITGEEGSFDRGIITSQTDLFLQAFALQTVGITGTKGKSTTSSLIAHILSQAGQQAILLGNIGIPAFHFAHQVALETIVVDELSSHQLEFTVHSPHIALILNLFEEHLDAYSSYTAYQNAKLNIARFQVPSDFLIYGLDNALLNERLASLSLPQTLLPFSLKKEVQAGGFRVGRTLIVRLPGMEELRFEDVHNRYLRGEHNLGNVLAALVATSLLGVSRESMLDGLDSFKGLAHRMEYVGNYHGIYWYNDSIATIPEACMAAINAIPNVETLILGGYDRGISYKKLAHFLAVSKVRTLLLTGNAGLRIGEELERIIQPDQRVVYLQRFDDFFPLALRYTRQGATCLLSPAASSYDEFRSFEERGFRFKESILSWEGDGKKQD